MDNTELLAQVSRILYNGDPMKIGCECDEYDPEASAIVPRLHLAKNKDDALDIVYEEFSRWFGGKSFAGPQKEIPYCFIINLDGMASIDPHHKCSQGWKLGH